MKDGSASIKSPMRSNSFCSKAGKRVKAPAQGLWQGQTQEQLSSASLRWLQAKMEAEQQRVREIIQPLMDIENGFMKELEGYLSKHELAQLRRKELLHKRWTEHVWMPIQKRVEKHASSCSGEDIKRRQSLYTQYIHHCNAKGFVFLNTCDLNEYNPYLLNIKKPHYFKHTTAEVKDPQLLKQKRTARVCAAGCKRRQAEKLPGRDHSLRGSAMPQTATPPQASSHHLVSASRQTAKQAKSEGWKSSRLDTIPYHIRETAIPDARCHQSGCWFSGPGHW